MSLTHIRVWRSLVTFMVVPHSLSAEHGLHLRFNGVTSFPRRAGRLAEENFGVSGNQKIGHGSDFLCSPRLR